MSKICSNCSATLKENQKFCTQCGTKYEEVKQESSTVNNNEEIKTYDKFGGFLIFFAILLVMGNLITINTISEYFKDEYISAINNMITSNYLELVSTLHKIFYLSLVPIFFLFLFTLSFFTKSNKTKFLAITYFLVNILITFIVFNLMRNHEVLVSEAGIEIFKSIIQMIFQIIFIIYFSKSKRVEDTFTKDKNMVLHSVIAFSIIAIIFYNYENNFAKEEIKSNKNVVQTSNNDNTTIDNSSSKVQKINEAYNKWEYKDWKIENINENYIRAYTLGGTKGDIFGIIKDKQNCETDFSYITTHIFKKSIQINKNDIVKFNLKVDKEPFNLESQVFSIDDHGFVRQMTITPQSLNMSFISKLKKGYKLETEITAPFEIVNHLEEKHEEYSLSGFTKAYNVLNEACRDINALKYATKNPIPINYSRLTRTNLPDNIKNKIEYIFENTLELIGQSRLSIYYSDEVNYYDWGMIPRKKVIEDKENYLKRWPYLRYEIDSFDNSYLDSNNNYVVNATIRFWTYSFSRNKGIEGKATYEIIIDIESDEVMLENSKIISKNNYEPKINSLQFGKYEFNFAGGNGTVESIELNDYIIIRSHGLGGTMIVWEGDYNEFINNSDYIIVDDVICRKSWMKCSTLDMLSASKPNKEFKNEDNVIKSNEINDNTIIKPYKKLNVTKNYYNLNYSQQSCIQKGGENSWDFSSDVASCKIRNNYVPYNELSNFDTVYSIDTINRQIKRKYPSEEDKNKCLSNGGKTSWNFNEDVYVCIINGKEYYNDEI